MQDTNYQLFTEAVIDDVKAWQNRPLEAVYPIVFFDYIVVKVREDKRIINKAVYVALGISLTGHKDVLGLWISQNEGSKQLAKSKNLGNIFEKSDTISNEKMIN